jgi:carboxypeptidase family protein
MAGRPANSAGGVSGALRGNIVDAQTNAALAGVAITAVSPSGNFHATTDAHGFFVLLQLPTDTYELSISKAGFQPQVLSGITILGDQTQSIGVIKMAPAVRTIGSVRVTAHSPSSAFQPTQTVDETTFVGKRVDQALGEAGSTNFQNLALSAPGVIATSAGSLNPISIRGSASVEIGYQFDGVDYRGVFFDENPNQNFLNGIGGGRGSLQVVSGAGDATQGGIGAGVVNVVPGRGSYPGSGFASFDVLSPYYGHSLAFQYGIATPDGRFSDFFSARSERAAPQIAPYGREAADAGVYNGESFLYNDDVLNNFYYRFGKNNDQQLQVLVDYLDHRSFAEYGGLSQAAFYPYNPASYSQFQADSNGAMWPGSTPLQQLQWYQSIIPYLPGVPQYPLGTTLDTTIAGSTLPPPLAQAEQYIYGPTDFLKIGWTRNLGPKTALNAFFYNWGGQVANNITGTSQALTTGDVLFATGYDPSGGRRIGFQAQLTTQPSEKHTLTFVAKFENGFPYWQQLNHGNTWVGLEAGRSQDLSNYSFNGINQYGAGPPPVVNGPRIEDWFLPANTGAPVSASNPCIGPAIDNGFNPAAPTAVGCYLYKYMSAHGLWNGALPIMPRTGFDYHNTDFQQWGIAVRDQWVPNDRWRVDYGLRVDGQNLKWAPQPFNADVSNPGDVGIGFATLGNSFLRPRLLEPRIAIDFTPNNDNGFRLSWGRSVSFQFGQTSGTPTGEVGIDPIFFQIPSKDNPAADPYNNGGLGISPTGVTGVGGSWLGPACGSGWHGPGSNGNGQYVQNPYVPFSGVGTVGPTGWYFSCQNYAASLYYLFDQTFAAPDLGGSFPPTYNNWDLAWEHQFRNRWGSKLTAYWRRGYNTHQVVMLNNGPPNPVTGQQTTGAFQERETGTQKAFGIEAMLTLPDRPFGWTGFLTLNYVNELTDSPPVSGSDSLPPMAQYLLQTNQLFHQAFLPPLSARAGLTYTTRSGWRINPIFSADSGIPFGVGLTSIGYVNGVLVQIPTCNIGVCVPFGGPIGPNNPFNATCYSDPAFPGNYYDPRYYACRGNNEPSLAGQAYTRPRVYADLDLEYTRGPHTLGVYVTNLFNNYRGEPSVNTDWQAVATGIGGVQSGQFLGTFPGSAAYTGGARDLSHYDQPWLPFQQAYVPGRTLRFYYQIKL